MKKSAIFGLVVPLVSLLFSWALVDVTTWFALPERRSEVKLLVQHDPALGWAKIPNSHTLRVTPEYRVEERINSKGLRGPELAYEKPKDTYRILLLGDSFIEGYSVNDDQLISTKLIQKLGGKVGKKKLEIINGGTGGYSTDQEYLFLTTEGHKYHPDLVVLFLFQNDMHYNAVDEYLPLGRGRKPRFELIDEKLALTGIPVPDNAPPLGRALARWLMSHSFLYSNLYALIDQALPAIGVHPALPEEFEVYMESPPPSVAREWEVTRRLLIAARDFSHKSDARFLIFHVPSILEINDRRFAHFMRYYGKHPGLMSQTRIARDLERITTDTSRLEVVKTLNEFREAERQLQSKGLSLYYSRDRHWNAGGHEFAATLLEAHLAKPVPPELSSARSP